MRSSLSDRKQGITALENSACLMGLDFTELLKVMTMKIGNLWAISSLQKFLTILTF